MRGQIRLHPLPTSEAKKCAWETDAILHLSGNNSNRFLAKTDTLQISFKRETANICMRGQIQLHPLPTSRGKEVCMETGRADFTSLVATAIDFSQQTDTLQHPLKRGTGQHLHLQIQLHPLPTRGK
ncbi:hypothetical protein CEXT_723831 [Caerostris extrusa]|uniref:Uncharacterized protein n=1 Tax=Caerostris extrusa TaxID=172846 RepID=A0AAV4M3T3_CAEEX|nr:hypothetical protein CEXT_723831 [Caerostris extrusa]